MARVLQVAGLPVHEEEEEEGAGADDPEQVHDRLSAPEARACEWCAWGSAMPRVRAVRNLRAAPSTAAP